MSVPLPVAIVLAMMAGIVADRVVAVAAVDRLGPVGGAGDDLVVAEAAGQ